MSILVIPKPTEFRLRLSRSHPGTVVLIIVGILLGVTHVLIAVRALRDKSTTGDEIAHLTGGYNFNHWDDYRMHPENGVLPQRWQTLPMIVTGVSYPQQAEDAWKKSDVWLMGYRFFYQCGNNLAWMLASARTMNALFGAATALVVFLWSLRLWGPAGAVISAVLCVLCPTMLANSGLATSDMCMTLFFLLTLAAYWHHLTQRTKLSWILSPLALGLAAVAKYSALLLIPMFGILALIRIFQSNPTPDATGGSTTFNERSRFIVLSFLVHIAAVITVVWAFFGFRYTAFNPALPAGAFTFSWELMLSFGGFKAHAIEFCRDHQLLPEGYLYGLAFVLKHAEARGAFLDGDYSIYGWVEFFPKAFFYKTPPSLLVATAASAVFVGLGFRGIKFPQIRTGLLRVAPLLVLFIIYWLFSLTSHLNIGHRHLLPTYPVLYIFCGALGWAANRAWQQSRGVGLMMGLGVAALLGFHAKAAASIYPDFLAYFSPLFGGPREGYKHLVDSSLDWGQDLPGLKKWMDANVRPDETVYLSYFGTGEPAYYGIHAIRMAMTPDFDRFLPWFKCEPGVYAVSASMLQHVYASLRGDWTLENEREYQQMRLNEDAFRIVQSDPSSHPELFREISSAEWDKAWKLYSQLRFARLCHYLRARQPDGMVGYSILIYRLNQQELDSALNGSLQDWSSAIERALNSTPQP